MGKIEMSRKKTERRPARHRMRHTINLGAPVIARRGPGEPEFHARVVARTFGRQFFDVETADGEVLSGLTLVRPDEEAQAIGRAVRALDGVSP